MTIHRVCFVSPLSRPILEPDFPCDFGGAEVRAVNFAKGLTKFSEFQVSMVLRAYRHEKPHAIGGLQAFFEKADAPIARTKDIPPGLAFLPKLAQAKLQKTWRSLRKRIGISRPVHVYQQHLIASLPTDLVCCFGVNAYTYNILTAAKDSGKRTLLMVAHDQDFDVQTHSDIVKNYGGDVQVYR